MSTFRVAVIGAGVIGLSSALHILEQCPSADVTIFADAFSPNTTTNISAGFWLPHLLGKTPTDLLRKWSGKTLSYMLQLVGSDSAKYTGACVLSGYQMSTDEAGETPFWSDMVTNFRHLSKGELDQFPGVRSGYFFTTAILEPAPYLEFLMKRVQRKGARLKRRRVTGIEELSQEGYDVIVNCAGLGARDLVDDKEMQPVRGQVMRANREDPDQTAPVGGDWSGPSLFAKALALLLGKGMSYVVLGGTEYVGDENVDVSTTDSQRIWKSCVKYCPSLSEATVVSEHVGLRPARPTQVRLEKETLDVNGKQQVVVHNYGHGGGGVSLHWGCAEDAASLVKQALNTLQPTKSRL